MWIFPRLWVARQKYSVHKCVRTRLIFSPFDCIAHHNAHIYRWFVPSLERDSSLQSGLVKTRDLSVRKTGKGPRGRHFCTFLSAFHIFWFDCGFWLRHLVLLKAAGIYNKRSTNLPRQLLRIERLSLTTAPSWNLPYRIQTLSGFPDHQLFLERRVHCFAV